MGNFDDLSMAVASFGGNNKVIFDDLEKPSIMVGIPKMKYADVITGGTQDTLPCFIVDGVERDMLYISKYINVVVNERAYSLPMKDPKTYIDFDQSLTACRKKGAGWGLTPNALWSAIMLWCNRNNFLPRGNTNYDKSYEKAYERGVNTYVASGQAGGRTATGSGPVTWYHDGSPAGIADMCGDVWEWVSGLRIKNGEIQIIPYNSCMKLDCNMDDDSTEWKAVKPDGSLVAPGTAGTLHYDYQSSHIVINTATNSTFNKNEAFYSIAAQSGVSIPQIIKAHGLIKDTNDIYAATGHQYYVNTDGERVPLRGSRFFDTSGGGVGALHLSVPRSNSHNDVGFRSAYDEALATGN